MSIKIYYPLIINRFYKFIIIGLNFHFRYINFYLKYLHKINDKNYLKHNIIK